MKRSILSLGILLFLLGLAFSPAVYSPVTMIPQDFLDGTWIEYDPYSFIDIENSTSIMFYDFDDRDAWLYKEITEETTSIHWLSFERQWENINHKGYFYALTNDIDDIRGLDLAGKSYVALYLMHQTGIPTQYCIYLEECYQGSIYYDVVANFTFDKTYYTTVERYSSNSIPKVDVDIYSDSQRTNLTFQLTLDLHEEYTFKYCFAAITYRWDVGDGGIFRIGNFYLSRNDPTNLQQAIRIATPYAFAAVSIMSLSLIVGIGVAILVSYQAQDFGSLIPVVILGTGITIALFIALPILSAFLGL